jgi:hypothetical protein
MTVSFHDTKQSLSETLQAVRQSIQGDQITLGRLLELVGEQGLLLFVMLLMVPFLLPVSIPGVSTVFSLVVILVGIGVALNRLPWLPGRLLNRAIAVESLLPALDKGIRLTRRIDKVIQPRLLALTHGATLNRFNGVMMVVAGILLLFPLGLLPFSNTLPGVAVLLLAAGLLQRDGLFVLLGYLMVLITLVYFGALAYAVLVIGANLQDMTSLKALFQ